MAAAAYTLVDVTSGQTLSSVNADERRDPASLTKLMTAYLVFGALRQKAMALAGRMLARVSTASGRGSPSSSS